jgi:hypothetical protein
MLVTSPGNAQFGKTGLTVSFLKIRFYVGIALCSGLIIILKNYDNLLSCGTIFYTSEFMSQMRKENRLWETFVFKIRGLSCLAHVGPCCLGCLFPCSSMVAYRC